MKIIMTHNVVRYAVMSIMAILFACLFSCVLYTFYIQWRTTQFLGVVQGIRVGQTTQLEARKLLSPFRTNETDGVTKILGNDFETYSFQFENSGLHLLGLFRASRFGGGVTFRSGIVVAKGAGLTQYPCCSVGTEETIDGLRPYLWREKNSSGFHVDMQEPPEVMQVFLETHTSEKNREVAYKYNLGCITSLGGCRSVHEILPGVGLQ